MMNQDTIFFTKTSDWRKWLSNNYMQREPVWLLFYKKKTGKPSLNYNDVVEQALCFGWIDGTVKGIDNESYKRKLMPRTNFNNWSESNRIRVAKLINSNEMTKIGLAKIGNYATEGKLIWPEEKTIIFNQFSDKLFEILKSNQIAFSNFSILTLNQKSKYIQWVMSAKREETQTRRMNEAILLLQKNTKNLLK